MVSINHTSSHKLGVGSTLLKTFRFQRRRVVKQSKLGSADEEKEENEGMSAMKSTNLINQKDFCNNLIILHFPVADFQRIHYR